MEQTADVASIKHFTGSLLKEFVKTGLLAASSIRKEDSGDKPHTMMDIRITGYTKRPGFE